MTMRRPTLGWGGVRYVSSRLLMTALFGVLLFAAAGRLNWVQAWLYMAIVFIGEVVSAAVLAAVNPEVLNRRGTTIRSDTKPFEGRALERELPGYREYVRQTRYRLLPGTW